MFTGLPFYVVLVLLIATTLIHYLTSQTRSPAVLPSVLFSRHAAERIVFLVPVIIASFAFRQWGGWTALFLAVLLMLPRAIWLSPSPADAIVETAATAGTGGLVVWLIERQAREKDLRQEAVARLSAIHEVIAIVTRSLDLEQTLNATLDKVLAVVDGEAGLIFTLDRLLQALVLSAYRGVSAESAAEMDRMRLSEGPYGQVAQSGEPVVVPDPAQGPPALLREGLQMQIVVPLRSRDSIQGVLAVACRRLHICQPQELELLTAIGKEIGVAIENARLYKRMQFYAREITRAQEDERQRIARELHDETIQMLIVVSRRLEASISPAELLPETTRQQLGQVRALIGDILGGARRLVRDLRPPALDHLGLVAAIRGLTRDLTEDHDIQTELVVEGETRRLAPEVELTLFRIIQEALSNVRRHSGASRATVRLAFSFDRVRAIIDDDGCGFDAPEEMGDLVSTGKLGLIGMDERAQTLGGTLALQSAPHHGSVVTVDVPLPML